MTSKEENLHYPNLCKPVTTVVINFKSYCITTLEDVLK
jgi:hypothetical protein